MVYSKLTFQPESESELEMKAELMSGTEFCSESETTHVAETRLNLTSVINLDKFNLDKLKNVY